LPPASRRGTSISAMSAGPGTTPTPSTRPPSPNACVTCGARAPSS
jgi:hypothetical protein